jgi:DNA polymerase III epsilon subunit-like protein
MIGRNPTPLIALDAVVIDTETTGLDPAKARIVEVAAVRIAGGRIDAAEPFRMLVRPWRRRTASPASGRRFPPSSAIAW